MAVIINEFEAVVEPPRRPESEPGVEVRPAGKDVVPSLTPLDMEDVLRRRLERLVRLLAD
jgi:hypothetical protein